MKKILLNALAFLFVLQPVALFSQTRTPQNIRRITVTNRYELNDGSPTSKFRAIKQEFYDSLGFMHTVVNLDHVSGKITGYHWNTFSSGQLVNIEKFENDKLVHITKISYSSNLTQKTEQQFSVVGSDTVLLHTTYYTLNGNGKPIKIEAKNANGKKLYSTKLVYNDKGLEVSRKVRAKKAGFPSDSILTLNCVPTYDSVGRLNMEKILLKLIGGGSQEQVVTYLYDKKGNLQQKTIANGAGVVSKSFRYKHNSKGKVTQEDIYDAHDKLIQSHAFRYEIYGKDLKNRTIEY